MPRLAALLLVAALLGACGSAHPAARAATLAPAPADATPQAARAVAAFAERWAPRIGGLPGAKAPGAYGRRARAITARVDRALRHAAPMLRTAPDFGVLATRLRHLTTVTIDAARFDLTQLHPPPSAIAQRQRTLLTVGDVMVVLETAWSLADKGIPGQIPAAVGPASPEVRAAEAAYSAAARG
jgi:hypothetical protein